jgi:hypothetical protein
VSDTQTRLDAVREAVGHYITALMVDASAVAGCERAMDEAFDALAAELERVTAALWELVAAAEDVDEQEDQAAAERLTAAIAAAREVAAARGGDAA